MLKAILAVMILAFGVANSAEPPKEKLAPDALKKKFYRCWLEMERVDAGVTIKEPIKLYGLQFATDAYWVWNRRGGELSAGGGPPGVRFDPTTEPMRVDILGDTREVAPSKREMIQVGICQFDGEKLILVVAPWQMLAPPEKGKDYSERPTEFKSTKENKWQMSKLKPAEFYDQD